MDELQEVAGWESLIGTLPLIITELDGDLRVLRQFNADDTSLTVQTGDTFLENHNDQLKKAYNDGETIRFETTYDGHETRHYAHVVKRPADSSTLVVSSTDITAQKQAETVAQQESHFLQRLLDTIDAGVTVFNFERMETIYANQYVQTLNGSAPQDMPERHYLKNIHPEDYDRVWDYSIIALQQLSDDEVGTNEFRVLDHHGNTRWMAVRDVVLTRNADGKVTERLGVAIDITERRVLEDEYARVRRWFDAILNTSTDAIAISTVGSNYDDSQFIAGNQRLEELTGYSLQEFMTIKPSDLLADSEDPDRIHRRRIKGTDSLSITEGLGKRKDGTIYPFEGTAVRVYDDEDTIIQLALVRDITERKQHEQALEDARLKAETALKARDAFIANMSHELRSPLNTIHGYAQLILDQSDLTPEIVESLHMIDDSAAHLSRLIDDVLDLSRIEAGFDTLHSVTFDVRYMLDRLRGILDIQAKRKSLALQIEFEDEVPQYIRTDEVKLKQIIINIVDNAIKYTESGTITVKIQLEHDAILRCVVQDTGRGFAEPTRQRLLQPYEREESWENTIPGTGLGLAITLRLVNLMGGKLDIKSEPEKGTTH